MADYLLPPGMTIAAAGRELASRLNIRAGRPSESDRVYYDTFDGLLHAVGLVVVWEAGQLALIERGSDRIRARVEAAKPNGRLFARDLPPGRIRDALGRLIEVRALLELVEVRLRERALDVLDAERKTVVRMRLEAPAVGRRRLGARVHLAAVRGYEPALGRVSEALASELGFSEAAIALVDEAVTARGGKPGGTPAKIHTPISPDQRADTATVAVLRALLGVIEANLPGTIDDVDAEFLHDLRVSLRRSRAVQRELGRVLPAQELGAFREEFRWLQQVTGDTRDLDVYVLEFDAMRALVPEAMRPDLEALLAVLCSRRASARRRMVRALRSDRVPALVAGWRSFLDKVEGLPVDDRPDATSPIGVVAGKRIWKVYRRMLKMGTAIAQTSPSTEYHELRKQGKELRYLLELFGGPLYPDELVRPMVKSLKALQDVLGRHQDREIQVSTLRSMGAEVSEGPGGPAALMAMGVLVERLAEDQQAARASFAERFEAFASASRRRAAKEAFD